MHITRVDDYQTWLIELGGHRIVVDPWLTERFSLLGSWFFGRQHKSAPAFDVETIQPLDLIVLTAHFADHLNPATLKAFPRTIPVVASATAAQAARRLGFQRVEPLLPAESFELDGGHRLTAIAPAFPYAHNSLGFLFEDADGARAYLETHVAQDERAQALAPVDLAILPVESVYLMGIQFAMDAQRATRVARHLRATHVAPTGLTPNAAEGLFARWFLRCRGGMADFQNALNAEEGAVPSFMDLAPGERRAITPRASGRLGPQLRHQRGNQLGHQNKEDV